MPVSNVRCGDCGEFVPVVKLAGGMPALGFHRRASEQTWRNERGQLQMVFVACTGSSKAVLP